MNEAVEALKKDGFVLLQMPPESFETAQLAEVGTWYAKITPNACVFQDQPKHIGFVHWNMFNQSQICDSHNHPEAAWRNFFADHDKDVKGLRSDVVLPFEHLPLADAGYTKQNAREHFHVVVGASKEQKWPHSLYEVTQPLISTLEQLLNLKRVV